jgi:hypothetical protein
MVTRRLQRAPEDGYEHDLVPGLRASADAARLADELAFSAARIAELRATPPGLLAEIAAAGDREAAARQAFLVAYLGPLEGAEDPFVAARQVAADAAALDGAPLGPRTAHDPGRGLKTIEAFDAWAARQGGAGAALVGDEDWDAARRYDRAFERLALPGFPRAARLEFLLLASSLGLADFEINTLNLSAAPPTDPVMLAAKRILGIGDVILLRRRAHEVAEAADVPLAALDLALFNWSAPSPEARSTAGSAAVADPTERDRIATALGVAPASEADAATDADPAV